MISRARRRVCPDSRHANGRRPNSNTARRSQPEWQGCSFYDLAVIDEFAARRTSQSRLLNVKAPGSDGSSDEKITGEMSPGSDLGGLAGACLHVEEYHQRKNSDP